VLTGGSRVVSGFRAAGRALWEKVCGLNLKVMRLITCGICVRYVSAASEEDQHEDSELI
jgi:hypothetical protein